MVEVKVMVDVAVTCGVGGPGFNPSSLLEYEVFGKKTENLPFKNIFNYLVLAHSDGNKINLSFAAFGENKLQ